MWDYLKSIDEKAYEKHRQWMQLALNLAATAGDRDDVPVGAVIVDKQGHLIAQGANCKEKHHDPTAHAEILAIRAASQVPVIAGILAKESGELLQTWFEKKRNV